MSRCGIENPIHGVEWTLVVRGPMVNKRLHEDVTRRIIGCAFGVMNELGVGFLESVYERAMVIALEDVGVSVRRQVPITVSFRGQPVGEFLADLLVEDKVIVELKAIEALTPQHAAQAINYLQATGIEVGLLLNFGRPRLQYRRVTRWRTDKPS